MFNISDKFGWFGEPEVAFWSCSLENTQAKVLFIRISLWRSNQPVPVSHLHLRCSIQLIENMAILNYFLAAHWHSQGSCCCSPINIILLYRLLFWHSVLLYWHIYSLLYKWIILFIIYSFKVCCVCVTVQVSGVEETLFLLNFLLANQIFQLLSQHKEANLWINRLFSIWYTIFLPYQWQIRAMSSITVEQ